MFTGIVEEVGVVSSLIRKSSFLRLAIYSKKCLQSLKMGDSVAVNGVCLTVADMGKNNFSVDVSEETLKSSHLVHLKIGDRVNLELALLVGGRIGGHVLSGHVDGVAEIRGKIKRGEGIEVMIAIPRACHKYLVNKGCIALNGVSLTIAKITEQDISVMLIPETLKNTNLGQVPIGGRVNFEVDLLSKYVEKHLQGNPPSETEKIMFNAGIMPMGIMEN